MNPASGPTDAEERKPRRCLVPTNMDQGCDMFNPLVRKGFRDLEPYPLPTYPRTL